ncbi:3-oxoacyl-ACP synthase III family protein [Herbiconiux sp. L3-i23]|uniref:3-oxoacyl-ACP synthase III family protein n=1 Tax=Herbiconiux sp. L3-i23 TaxID=2905871 RepID=UPI002059D94D|nr:ketoacyl-ACP synthase III [Herbiconiux sp. L3-i23]BDI21647.1 3-oxoacyl-ACP synthase [Herbiconiux sp. L3-i23]
MAARIAAVSYHLPAATLSNADLAAEFPEWSVEKIGAKTGIVNRHVAADDEFASDLAVAAAQRLFDEHGIDPNSIDYVLLCTQSPDYYMPTTAVLVQERLGLRTSVGATDITLGCSGYVYALGLAKGLIESGQVRNVLVLTTDTYTRFVNPRDKSVRTLFGDGASASLVTDDGGADALGSFVYGSDGSGGGQLVVPNGGLKGSEAYPAASPEARGFESNGYDLYMDGPGIFNFTLEIVPKSVDAVLAKAGLQQDEVDLWVFHQANAFMLEHLRKKLGVPSEHFVVAMGESGNTVSSTIPIALVEAERAGQLTRGMKVMILGFGVGLSWAGAVLEW